MSQSYIGSEIEADHAVSASVSASAVAFVDFAMSCCGVSSASATDMVLQRFLQCQSCHSVLPVMHWYCAISV